MEFTVKLTLDEIGIVVNALECVIDDCVTDMNPKENNEARSAHNKLGSILRQNGLGCTDYDPLKLCKLCEGVGCDDDEYCCDGTVE